MRYATIATAGGSAIAAVEGDDVHDLTPTLFEAGHRWVDLSRAFAAEGGFDAVKAAAKTATGDPLAIDAARFLPPLPSPDHVLAVAANYKAHIEETGTITYAAKAETSPWFFTKPQSSINGHQSPIRLPAKYGDQVDWEAELGVVIGTGGGNIAPEDAWDHIAGYTVVNDISARRMQVQERTKLRERDSFHDWLHGKWFDTFCCVGPGSCLPRTFPIRTM